MTLDLHMRKLRLGAGQALLKDINLGNDGATPEYMHTVPLARSLLT